MKPDQLYHNLKEIAEKIGITVKEYNFRNAGIHVRSGLCKIREEQFFIMDKRLTVREKTENLAECLRDMDLETVYIVPAIREILLKPSFINNPSNKKPDPGDAGESHP
jgi:hypothetical protein